MPVAAELEKQWDAFLRLVQVREPRLFDHLKAARVKEVTKYNLLVMAHTADDLKEIEVGLKVYHERIGEFTHMVFGDNKGIKTELASEEDWQAAAPAAEPAPASPPGPAPAAPPPAANPADQNELLKVLEASIRQKIEAEIKTSMQAAAASPEVQREMMQKLKEDFDQEEENRRMAVRMALIAEGDKILTQLVMIWQQAKQNGDGGPQWNEVKQRLLELLDATVQMTHS